MEILSTKFLFTNLFKNFFYSTFFKLLQEHQRQQCEIKQLKKLLEQKDLKIKKLETLLQQKAR